MSTEFVLMMIFGLLCIAMSIDKLTSERKKKKPGAVLHIWHKEDETLSLEMVSLLSTEELTHSKCFLVEVIDHPNS